MTDQIDLNRAPDPVLAALSNIDGFDRRSFELWLSTQKAPIRKAATIAPPDRIYELKGKLCFVHGKDGHVVLRGVGDPDQVNVHAYADEIRDVTNDLRRQRGLVV